MVPGKAGTPKETVDAGSPTGLAEAAGLFGDVAAPPPARPGTPPGAEGHRERLRQRLMTVGPEALADHELLEALLFVAIPRRDTKAIAKRILGRFGTFSAAVSAPAAELLEVEDVGLGGGSAEDGGCCRAPVDARGGDGAAGSAQLGPADGVP
jgi:hypothetical protein